VDVEVRLVAGFPDVDLRGPAAPPALDPDAAVEEAAATEGRNDEVEGFFAGAAPGVSELPDPVAVFRIVELVVGVALAGLEVVDGFGTGGFEAVEVVRILEVGRAFALDAVELGRGARAVATTGGLPIEPVIGFGFGFGAVTVAVESLEVEEVAVEGRCFAVVGLEREGVIFFGLAGGLLDGEAGSGEAV
jgi:hypothetical protein